LNTKAQVSIFGVIAFLIVFFILYVLVFAPFMNVASDVSIGHDGVDGMVGFMVNYWAFIVFLCFIMAFGWKIYAG
jgi:F0F1-type ATP synthase membrane subunit b/b'